MAQASGYTEFVNDEPEQNIYIEWLAENIVDEFGHRSQVEDLYQKLIDKIMQFESIFKMQQDDSLYNKIMHVAEKYIQRTKVSAREGLKYGISQFKPQLKEEIIYAQIAASSTNTSMTDLPSDDDEDDTQATHDLITF